MYTPDAFAVTKRDEIFRMIVAAGLAQFVTATAEGPVCTPLPLLLDPTEGENGTLYGHLARANPQWRAPVLGPALAIFSGPDGYVSPGWYPTKQETGKVVPTWNYVAVQAFGPVEFFTDTDRLLGVVERLTDRHETGRPSPWQVSDAPEPFVAAQLRGIVGLRLPIARLAAKRKMSQNRPATDRAGVRAGLLRQPGGAGEPVAALIPE